jgi:hypothetical protein
MTEDSSHISFIGPLPGDPDAQREISDLVREALANLPGPWKVGVTPGATAGSCIVTAYRDDGFECSVFLDSAIHRTFLHLRDQVVNALQMHVLGLPHSLPAVSKPKS